MSTTHKSIQLWDGLRIFFQGSLQPVLQTIGMLILVECFRASTTEKTILAVTQSSGLIFSMLVIMTFSRKNIGKNKIIFGMTLCSSIAILLAALSPNLPLYIISIVCSYILSFSQVPLYTEIYSQYDKEQRAKKFLTTLIANLVGTLLFSYLYSVLMKEVSSQQFVLVFTAFFLLLSAFFSLKLPSQPVQSKELTFKVFLKVMKEDKLFTYICFLWYLLGVGNLWIFPYRTNYLYEEQYGYQYSAETILILLVVTPSICRFLIAPFFAKLFDKINFIVLRMILNMFFIIYVAMLFFGDQYWMHLSGMIAFGVAFAGGEITWNLWTTRFAPKEKVSIYMSIHAALTGTRGVLSPIFGLWALENMGPSFCATISIGLIAASSLMLLPIIKWGKSRFNH